MGQRDATLPHEILDSATKLLVDLCAISSASSDSSGVRAMAERMAAELRRCGLAAEIVAETDDTGTPMPLLVACGPAASEHPLVVVGHLDTVLDAEPPRLEAGRLLATGALDMKGGLATLVGALDLLSRREEAVPADLVVVCVPDEEAGGSVSERAVRRWAEGARALLVIEPGEPRCDAETVVGGRRGLFEWTLEVSGRAAHSGLGYWKGRSALAAAADWAAQAERMSETGPGVTVNVARLVAGDADFVNGLALHHALLGTSRRRNIVSDRAIAEGEARFLTAADGVRILGRLQRLAENTAAAHDVRMTFAQGMRVPPVDPHGPGAAIVERVTKLAAQRGWRLEVEEDRGGISFPNYVTDPARVAIVDGLGPVGDGMHTREEYLDLHSFERRIVLLADVLTELAPSA